MNQIKMLITILVVLLFATTLIYSEEERATSPYQNEACSMAVSKAQSAASGMYCRVNQRRNRRWGNCNCWQNPSTKQWTCSVNWTESCQ